MTQSKGSAGALEWGLIDHETSKEMWQAARQADSDAHMEISKWARIAAESLCNQLEVHGVQTSGTHQHMRARAVSQALQPLPGRPRTQHTQRPQQLDRRRARQLLQQWCRGLRPAQHNPFGSRSVEPAECWDHPLASWRKLACKDVLYCCALAEAVQTLRARHMWLNSQPNPVAHARARVLLRASPTPYSAHTLHTLSLLPRCTLPPTWNHSPHQRAGGRTS